MRRRHNRQQRNDILRLRRLLFKGKSQKPALRHSHFPCRVLFRRGHRLPFRKDIIKSALNADFHIVGFFLILFARKTLDKHGFGVGRDSELPRKDEG